MHIPLAHWVKYRGIPKFQLQVTTQLVLIVWTYPKSICRRIRKVLNWRPLSISILPLHCLPFSLPPSCHDIGPILLTEAGLSKVQPEVSKYFYPRLADIPSRRYAESSFPSVFLEGISQFSDSFAPTSFGEAKQPSTKVFSAHITPTVSNSAPVSLFFSIQITG